MLTVTITQTNIMRKITLLLIVLLGALIIQAQVQVRGYTRKNGTYVAPHVRSSPNSTRTDNYSYPGNTNPYTGKIATGDASNTIKQKSSDVWVNGYYRKDGTYVSGYWRSAPDGDPTNNFSYPGNTNPYTGKTATGDVDTYLKNNSERSYYIISKSINVRSGPGTNYPIVRSLNYGDNLEVVESINSSWKKVNINSTIGYVFGPNLSATLTSQIPDNEMLSSSYSSSSGTAYTNPSITTDKFGNKYYYVIGLSARVRSEASESGSIITTLSYGDKMVAIDASNAVWIKVKISYYNSSMSYVEAIGYVNTTNISTTKPR